VTSTDTPVQIDTDKLMAFVFRAVEEVGATLNCALVVMGGQLGCYRDLASHGPATAAGLAARAQTGEPYAREWLNAQAAGGFVGYDAQARRRAHRRNQPGVPARPVPDRARHRPGRTADHRGGAPRRGAGMAPAQPRCPPRMRAVLPARVHGQPQHLLAARPGRRGRQAAAWRQGSQRGMRARRLHRADGPGL
jgi:hypothetical protein